VDSVEGRCRFGWRCKMEIVDGGQMAQFEGSHLLLCSSIHYSNVWCTRCSTRVGGYLDLACCNFKESTRLIFHSRHGRIVLMLEIESLKVKCISCQSKLLCWRVGRDLEGEYKWNFENRNYVSFCFQAFGLWVSSCW
jgi:hypothetical protein